jgi:vacuolar-type H+-ATPase subunit I/STV1
MTQETLLDAQIQAKRMYGLLTEVMDVSRQLTEAVDRDDKVTIEMLLSMRAEPIEELRRIRRKLEIQRDILPEEDARRLGELLSGAEAKAQEETGLANQIGANTRLLRQLVELDERLNHKITRDHSFYNK